ncbi:MAG: protein kinase domain-containing protein [bacterium]|nr:MAG: protein kinase domain-containing protein [bacterium]
MAKPINFSNAQLNISSSIDVELHSKMVSRAEELFQQQQQQVFERTDRLFGKLLVFEWIVGIITAIWISPRAWDGLDSQIHLHVWAALFLGLIIISFPVYLSVYQPGKTVTRHCIAIAQMLSSALLIHLSGGRIETHFHVFGSLAFLAFYSDWRVLLTASIVVGLDHFIRGVFWPASVFGVNFASNWRWLEHSGWIAFEVFFLTIACSRTVKDMAGMAYQNAQLETINSKIEGKVQERTAQLNKKTEELAYQNAQLEAINSNIEGIVRDRTAQLDKKTEELAKKNFQLANTINELKKSKESIEQTNQELLKTNQELIDSNRRADRIFSTLAEALPGKILDEKYRLDSKIGAGGFGAVYRATHLGLNRPIAVKVFRPTEDNASAENLERFLLEGISTCRVSHPNAVSVLDAGISIEGMAYLVMELLEGWSLGTELKDSGKLSIKRCLNILIPVADVLAEAHRNGIIHRDIKPENIFLHQTKEGEVIKVVDFGIAKLVDKNEKTYRNITGTGNLVGTPTYMSPERLSNKPYDGRSDIYSLGILLYQMLAGCVPFDDGYRGIVSLIMMHLKQSPPPLKEFDPDIPDELEKIVMKTLEKNPEDRLTALELTKVLREFNNNKFPEIDTDLPRVCHLNVFRAG